MQIAFGVLQQQCKDRLSNGEMFRIAEMISDDWDKANQPTIGDPVAWRFRHVNYVDWSLSKDKPARAGLEIEPLYATKPTMQSSNFPAGATGVGLGGDTQREQNPSTLSSQMHQTRGE